MDIVELREWERPYREALVGQLRPSGDVLQIGFGEGHSATFIQTYKPKSHTIIENDPLLAAKAKRWASQYEHILIIEETWQKALPGLGIFAAILFGEFPLDSMTEINQFDKESLYVKALLKEGKELLSALEKQHPTLLNTAYSDQDLEEFCQAIAPSQLNHLSRFLSELKSRGQISERQYERTLQKYHLEKEEPGKDLFALSQQQDPLFDLLMECLTNHMQKGSRFACFLRNATSKYENPSFFEHIITNPHVDYQEKSLSLKIPPETPATALLMLVEKS